MDPTGTSGQPVGPDIIITDDTRKIVLPPGETGNILIRGAPWFAGYESSDPSLYNESFFTVGGEAGWFDTGDTGYLDEKSFLFISGRSKEVMCICCIWDVPG